MNGNTKAVYRAIYKADKHTASIKDLLFAVKNTNVKDIKLAIDDLVALGAVKATVKDGEVETVTSVYKGPTEAEITHKKLMEYCDCERSEKNTLSIGTITPTISNCSTTELCDTFDSIRRVMREYMRD